VVEAMRNIKGGDVIINNLTRNSQHSIVGEGERASQPLEKFAVCSHKIIR